MASEVYMDIPAVLNMGGRFDDIGNILKQVDNALEVSMTILKTTAFVGLVGGVAIARYLDMLRPIIQKLSEDSLEVGNDLRQAVEAFQRQDEQGATRFY